MNDDAARGPTLFKRLRAINRTVSTSLNFEEALGLIAGSGVELVGATSCVVLLREGEEELRICASQGVDPSTAARFIGAMEESVLGQLRTFLGFPGSQSITAAPIMSDRILKGILVVIRNVPPNAEEALLLAALADQAAITLRNADLHETTVAREAKFEADARRSGMLARELEALIHSVAQYLRAPLRTMTECGKVLLNEGGGPVLTDQGRECLGRLAADARSMDGLIDGLFTYCQLADADVRMVPIDLEGAVLEALSELESELGRRGALVRVEPPLVKVLAQQSTLARVLSNLISHAMKVAGPGGPPVLVVGAELHGDVVRVSVRDDGTGLPTASPDRVSGVVERPDRAGEAPATDIELAIAQRGAERMGGRCGVESKPGQGKRFWIDLHPA